MLKKIICCVVVSGVTLTSSAQISKSTKKLEELWFSYHNQARLTEKWELLADVQLRTREDFVNQFSQSIFRLGISWYLNSLTKFTAGYAFSNVYSTVLGKSLTQSEHRPWQQFQWESIFGKKRLAQRFRLEERFREKVLDNAFVGEGYNFNFRFRYNIGYEVPLSKKGLLPKSFSLVLNEDLNINMGKEIVYNTFDQNRLFAGVKYQFNQHNNLTLGYMNLFQQTALGNKYILINAFRFIYVQNLDLRM